MTHSDTVLSGGLVARSLSAPLERVDVTVSGGRIAAQAANGPSVDVSGCLVIPGNVCAHHHLYSALARGMPGPKEAPRNFIEILQRVWWRLDQALTLEDIELSARLGALEAAKAGTTSLVDHHASPRAVDGALDAVASGIEAAGVRGIVCYEVTDRHGMPGGRAGIAENERFLRTNERPLVRAMMGAHASFTIGPSTMEALVGTARNLNAGVHVHVAEDEFDERDCLERYGFRTAERLAKAGALQAGDLIAHGVHLDEAEVELVRSSGVWVAHNPRSNMNNGVGYAPVASLGDRVALGTDGIDGDMFAEARVCYLKAREASWRSGPSFAVERLACGASMVASMFSEPALGRLDPGAPADLIVLDYAAPTPVDDANLHGHFIFGPGRWSVRDVMCAGRWIVRDRRHEIIDEDETYARCREAAPAMWERMQRI